MRIGVGAPVAGAWATPQNLALLSEQAEHLGYQSLWTFQRLLVGEGQQLAPVYRSVLDPLVALGFVAARTTSIRLGVAVVNLPFVSPVYLAKQAATVDLLSGGRLDLGLGTGWSAEEFTASGTSLRRRGARAEEYLQALSTLFGDDISEHDGEFYSIPRSRMYPKAAQNPGPPVLLGGSARPALERVGRLAAGWVSRSATDLSSIADDIGVITQAARNAGRDPSTVRIAVRGVVRLTAGAVPDADRPRLTGSADQIRADVAWLGEQGVTEVFYDLNWDPQIGSPDVDPRAATDRATEVLHSLAPG